MKDQLTPVAIGLALAAILVAMVLDGGSPVVLFKPAPLILVFGGTISVSIAGLLKRDVKDLKVIFKQAMGRAVVDLDSSIEGVVQLAQVAKTKEGLLGLDDYVKNVDDSFLELGVQLIVDGVSTTEIRDILESEVLAMEERHRKGIKFFTDMGGFSPTLGILGTVIGLVTVLGHLSNPGALGPGIASAFSATLWGVLSANVFWLPIANKLQRISAVESQVKTMQTEGLLAIQNGNTSRMVRARMETFLPAGAREGSVANEREAA
jgi:chemotaxis protein MotA